MRAFRQDGDQAAGQRVITANLRQVVMLALRYRSPRARAAQPGRRDEVVARRMQQGQLLHAVACATSGLNQRERYILEHRLLADQESRLPLREVGKSFGVTRERARQLEQAVRAKLKTRLTANGGQLELPSAA